MYKYVCNWWYYANILVLKYNSSYLIVINILIQKGHWVYPADFHDYTDYVNARYVGLYSVI